MEATMTNPLLHPQGLPAFAQIHAEHINPAIDSIIRDNTQQLADLLGHLTQPSWKTWRRHWKTPRIA